MGGLSGPSERALRPGACPTATPEAGKRRSGEVDESALGRVARAEAYRELIGDRQQREKERAEPRKRNRFVF